MGGKASLGSMIAVVWRSLAYVYPMPAALLLDASFGWAQALGGRKLWVGASRMLEFLVYAFFTSKSHNQDGLSRRAQASRPRQLGAGKMAQAKRQER
ncbi:MAG: hypothetical protein EBZ01_03820 [Betaproteobacteria bacterium]|nr:hypothetical protein [Betaproteobacteria bacterium]